MRDTDGGGENQLSRWIPNASSADSSDVSVDQLSWADISTEPFILPSPSSHQFSDEEAPALSFQSSENDSSDEYLQLKFFRASTPVERTSAFMLGPSLTFEDELSSGNQASDEEESSSWCPSSEKHPSDEDSNVMSRRASPSPTECLDQRRHNPDTYSPLTPSDISSICYSPASVGCVIYDDWSQDYDAYLDRVEDIRGEQEIIAGVEIDETDKFLDGQEDEDCNPASSKKPEDPHIRVGPEFQANVAEGLELYDTHILPYENEDILLWNPQPISEQSTEEYLSHASAASNVHLVKGIRSCPQRMGISDDEEQLYILQKCQYNQTVALTRLKYNFEPTFESMTDWSERECRQFEDGLLKHGKNFFEIQKEFVTTRRINEIVQFYYMWKKQTNRPEVFLKQQEEKEKRKAANASDQAKSRKGSMDAASISDQEKDMFAASSSSPVASTSSAADKRGIVLPKRKYSTRIFNFKPQTGTRNPGFIQDAANPITEELNRTESITKRRRCNDEPISTDGGDAKIEENEV